MSEACEPGGETEAEKLVPKKGGTSVKLSWIGC